MRGAPPPLYPWQAAAIDLVASIGRSLVYTAPTGGGKSRVADELLRRRLDANPRARALVVLPYVALVREKVASLEKALREIKAEVRGYAGTECEGAPLAGRERGAVATIEKASGCVNRMFERGEIENLAVVVVDELHMVSENERGATLEGMLAKIRHAVKSGRWRAEDRKSSPCRRPSDENRWRDWPSGWTRRRTWGILDRSNLRSTW